jgi:hypothetical protein
MRYAKRLSIAPWKSACMPRAKLPEELRSPKSPPTNHHDQTPKHARQQPTNAKPQNEYLYIGCNTFFATCANTAIGEDMDALSAGSLKLP